MICRFLLGKKESADSDRLAEMELKPDTIGLSGGKFSKNSF